MYMCGGHALMLTSQTLRSSLQNIAQVPLRRVITDPENGQKFTSSEPRRGNKECPEERKTRKNKVVACSAGEGDEPWQILKT